PDGTGLDRDLRLRARRRAAGRPRLGRLCRHLRRDPARGAGGGGRARPARRLADGARLSAVALACVSALLFGAMSVALRIGLRRSDDTELATITCVGVAALLVLVWAAAEVPARGAHAAGAWPFALAGLLSPGAAQLLVV